MEDEGLTQVSVRKERSTDPNRMEAAQCMWDVGITCAFEWSHIEWGDGRVARRLMPVMYNVLLLLLSLVSF